MTIFSQNVLIRPVPICPNALSGQHLNISVVGLSPPNAIFNSQGEIVGGVSLDVFNIMANKLEFTYTLKTEYSWGDPIPNSKEWNGVVGAVRITNGVCIETSKEHQKVARFLKSHFESCTEEVKGDERGSFSYLLASKR